MAPNSSPGKSFSGEILGVAKSDFIPIVIRQVVDLTLRSRKT